MTGMFSQIDLLSRALTGSQHNHRVLSQNVANVNTPGYKTLRVDFGELLNQLEAVSQGATGEGGNPNDPANIALSVHELEGLADRVDGNNVELEREVSELKKNALAAQAYNQLMASRLATLRRAMSSS